MGRKRKEREREEKVKVKVKVDEKAEIVERREFGVFAHLRKFVRERDWKGNYQRVCVFLNVCECVFVSVSVCASA